jgi:hypothetical protein
VSELCFGRTRLLSQPEKSSEGLVIKASHTLHQFFWKISQCCLQTAPIFPTLPKVTVGRTAVVFIVQVLRAALTEHFINYPQHLQAWPVIISQITSYPLRSTSLPIHSTLSFLPYDATHSKLLVASLNKLIFLGPCTMFSVENTVLKTYV